MNIQKISLIILLCSFQVFCFAQKNLLKDRKDLQDLLEERKEKFSSYTSSLEKRSGIFGNKTKRDIQASNEVLINIVQTDNRIISTLYRVIDLRNMEKSSKNFDAAIQNQNYDNLLHATDTLSKQVEALTATSKKYRSKATKFEWLFYAMSALVVLMVARRWRKKTGTASFISP